MKYNRVKVGAHYIYHPNLLDIADGRTSLQSGDEVVVVNLPGAPKANTFGHCYVNRLDGSFAGLVHCNSLHTKAEYIAYLRNEIANKVSQRPITKENTVAKTKRTLKLTGDGPAVKARQRIEQTIALTVAQSLLDAGYLLGVNDSEETTIHHSCDLDAIQAALFTTDDDYLYVYVKGGNKQDVRPDYWVHFVYGNDGWDVVCDYSNHLDSVIGDGTVAGKLIDYASENGVVPVLYNK